jgi:ribose/xylose/arabinose/galactoside ABC-type transport system permease subunit
MRGHRSLIFADFGREIALAGAIVIAVVALSAASPSFLTPANIANIGTQSSMVLIVSIGMTILIIGGGIDLSVGSLAAFVGMFAVWLMVDGGLPATLALAVGFFAGAMIGLLHGVIVVFFRVPGIIVTLGSMTALRGVTSLFANGAAIQSESAELAFLAWGHVAGIPCPVIAVILSAIAGHALLQHSRLGRGLYAVGGNAQAARAAGISIATIVVVGYAISALAAALAGLLAASRAAAGSPIIGMGWELKAIAVVVLGGANLFGGSGRILGTLLAGLLLAIIENGASLLAMTSWVEGFLVGLLLIAVVAMNAIGRSASLRRQWRTSGLSAPRDGPS